jgi:tripartite ATP-independent transporter DctP family solute receptor
MDKKSLSFFFVGICTGLVIAVGGFTWYVRSHGVSGSQSQGIKVLKLGHGLDAAHPVHKAMVFMGERLKEKSAGTIDLQIYSGGVLGNETESIELLQRGSMDMTKVSTASMEGFVRKMGVFSLPYIFRDHTHFWNVLESPLGEELLQAGQELGLRGLCYYDSGSRNFYTYQKPVQHPDDLNGMKIRVLSSPRLIETIEAFGAFPTSIPWGELYTALQQKMVDGAENNPPSFYTSRHFEVCKYFAFNEHTRIPDIILIAAAAWDTLTPEQQQWIQQAADESKVFQRKLWDEFTEESVEKSKEEGVEFFYPDLEPFKKEVQPVIEKYSRDPVIGPILEQMKEIQ